MSKIHENFPCRLGKIRRFGGRRRQCTGCGATWRVWKAQQGRKPLRISPEAAHRFIFHAELPTRLPRADWSKSRNQRQYRLSLSRRRCAETCSWPLAPNGVPLILIADGLIKRIRGAWHTWYFMLVRSINDNDATIMVPYHRQRSETGLGWRAALDTLPDSVQSRIVALVSDGHQGLIYEARKRGWLIQRCHFHLIARIQSRRSKWKMSRHYEEGKRVYKLVKHALTTRDESAAASTIEALEKIWRSTPSRALKNILRGFSSNYREYRTYLIHPELRLPTTNNTAEALIGLVENICNRARGFSQIETLHEWITCLCKTRKTIRCAPPKSTE